MLKYVHIAQNRVQTSAGEDWLFSEENSKDFLKAVYKKLEVEYPKFYKMDDLCKLAFLSVEMLFNTDEPANKATCPILFANTHTSAKTDIKHLQKMQTNDVSPAVFVYTLPNIAIGEVAIRHGMKGENIFILMKNFSAQKLRQYATVFEADELLVSWVECTNNTLEAFAFIVDKRANQAEWIIEIENLYKKLHGRVN